MIDQRWRRAICRQCGATNLGVQPHCLLCRADLVDPPASPLPQRRFCGGCGSPIEADKRFCTRCGRELAP